MAAEGELPRRLPHGASPCGLCPHKQVIAACPGEAFEAKPDGARVSRAGWVVGEFFGSEALLLAVILSEAPGAESKDPLKSESGEFGTYSELLTPFGRRDSPPPASGRWPTTIHPTFSAVAHRSLPAASSGDPSTRSQGSLPRDDNEEWRPSSSGNYSCLQVTAPAVS